jgi:hypothetical protein
MSVEPEPAASSSFSGMSGGSPGSDGGGNAAGTGGPGGEHEPVAESAGPLHYRWWHKVGSVLFVIVSFEIGLSLVLLPWSHFWNLSLLSFVPEPVAASPYLKGAVTGLGFVNMWISFVEVFRLRRFAGH